MTQKLNVSSAVEFRQILFQCFKIFFPEVAQKTNQENGTKAKNVPGYREISVFGLFSAYFFNKGLAEDLVFRGTFGKKIS